MARRNTIITLTAAALIGVVGASSAFAAATITGSHIKNGTITGKDVKNGSLAGSDVKAGSIGASRLAPAAKSGGFEPVVFNADSIAEDTPTTATLTCPAGKVYAGGGAFYYVDTDADNAYDTGETVVGDATINAIKWNNVGSVDITATHSVNGAQGDMFAWAHCATA